MGAEILCLLVKGHDSIYYLRCLRLHKEVINVVVHSLQPSSEQPVRSAGQRTNVTD